MHAWAFARRFRRGGFGWRSTTAVAALREARAEVARAAREDPALGAEGAVALLSRLSPAFQNVDGSSGALGSAVNDVITAFVPLVGTAPLEPEKRRRLLERLWDCVNEDDYGYLDALEHSWGACCGSAEVARSWADERLESVRDHLAGERSGYHKGTIATLSALYTAGRYADILTLVDRARIVWWHYREWGFEALLALGRPAEALRYAQDSRGVNDGPAVGRACERVLLASGLAEEAYRRYGMAAMPYRSTKLATFRAMCEKYPEIDRRRILDDLAANEPGREGRWFAAAVSAGFLDAALALAERSHADPHTLLRAARKHVVTAPRFALDAAFLALHSMAAGWGFDVSALDALDAAAIAREAAVCLDCEPEFKRRLHAEEIVHDRFLRDALQLEPREPGLRPPVKRSRNATVR